LIKSSAVRVDLSLVVPFYNPGPIIRQTVERAAASLAGCGATFEIVAVSDGSTDDSEASLVGLLPGVLETVVLEANRGKGYAVRVGMARATGRFVGFIDADGDIPPETLAEFLRVAKARNPDILFGSKQHPGSTVTVPWVRRLASLGYRWLVRLLFRLSVPDTQTGIKLLKAELVAAILPKMVVDRFAFDLEIFVLAKRLGYDTWIDLPVRVDKKYSSTVSLRSARTIVWDTIKIYFRFMLRRPTT
jgi:glycosyltransferase involved in cell wall biosynthesis